MYVCIWKASRQPVLSSGLEVSGSSYSSGAPCMSGLCIKTTSAYSWGAYNPLLDGGVLLIELVFCKALVDSL